MEEINLDDMFESKEQEEEWGRRVDYLDAKVRKAVKDSGQRKCRVIFSVYKDDDKGLPIDNLDEMVIEGTAVFIRARSDYWGGERSRDYISEPVTNPTWLQICLLANKMIPTVRDGHHVFLEGVTEVSRYDDEFAAMQELLPTGVELYTFVMGS